MVPKRTIERRDDMPSMNTQLDTGIRCGHCGNRHDSVPAVRVCAAGGHIWPCGWLLVIGRDEDGQEIIGECGAESYGDDRGYQCSAGHSHVYAEVRAAEGWDYASDPLEAEALRRNGVDAVSARGDSI
jgi:hypothetical protein